MAFSVESVSRPRFVRWFRPSLGQRILTVVLAHRPGGGPPGACREPLHVLASILARGAAGTRPAVGQGTDYRALATPRAWPARGLAGAVWRECLAFCCGHKRIRSCRGRVLCDSIAFWPSLGRPRGWRPVADVQLRSRVKGSYYSDAPLAEATSRGQRAPPSGVSASTPCVGQAYASLASSEVVGPATGCTNAAEPPVAVQFRV